MKTREQLKSECKQYAINQLNDGVGEGYACDLHHELFNADYYIIGRFEAKEWLADYVFNAIEEIKEYEQDNFGEVNTDLSEPEKVANMLSYILGEEVLSESKLFHLKNGTDNDRKLEYVDLKELALDLKLN